MLYAKGPMDQLKPDRSGSYNAFPQQSIEWNTH